MSKDYVFANYNIIKANILNLFKSMKELEKPGDANLVADVGASGGDNLVRALLALQTSPATTLIWPYIKKLLRMLLEAFWYVTRSVISNLCTTWSFAEMEFMKYFVQICGCILFWFHKINVQYHFWIGKIELQLEPIAEFFGMNAHVN